VTARRRKSKATDFKNLKKEKEGKRKRKIKQRRASRKGES